VVTKLQRGKRAKRERDKRARERKRQKHLPNAPAAPTVGVFVATMLTRCKLCETFCNHTLLKARRSPFGSDLHHVLVCTLCERERRVERMREAAENGEPWCASVLSGLVNPISEGTS
jgi:hypothetical protein